MHNIKSINRSRCSATDYTNATHHFPDFEPGPLPGFADHADPFAGAGFAPMLRVVLAMRCTEALGALFPEPPPEPPFPPNPKKPITFSK